MDVSGLIKSINTATASVNFNKVDSNERRELLQACEQLRNICETPLDTIIRLYYSGPQMIILRLAVDLKLFDSMAKLSDQKANKDLLIEQLSFETGAEPLLIARIMKFLAAMQIVQEISENSFQMTPSTAAYISNLPLSAAVIHGAHFLSVLSKLPEYFAQNGWKSPNDAENGPFQFAMGTEAHYFDFLSSEPYYQQAFNTTMTASFRRKDRPWFTFFPVEEKFSGKDPTIPLLVDIGGGQGQDILAFRNAFPHLPGKLTLQDLPVVIENSMLPGIEAQEYNFFDEQPVKGAKAYYLRTVLHDWPDKQALGILARIREAMNPESLLLINEVLAPESNRSLSSVVADLTMMVSYAALQRTQAQFATLLHKAGFELINVWIPEGIEPESASLAQQAVLLEARMKH